MSRPALVVLLIASVGSPGWPAEAQRTLLEWARDTRAARLQGNYRAWLEAGTHSLAMAPDDPDLLISVARARAALAQVNESLGALRQAIERGAGIDIPRVQEFEKLPRSPELENLVTRAKANLAPVRRAEVFAVIPDPTAQSEGIAYDPVSGRLFVGTTHGEILQADQHGTITTFVPRGSGLLRGVLGLKVDADRRLLWAVHGAFPELLSTAAPKPDDGVSGVIAFRLKDGQLVEKYWLDERPVLHAFNDLALERNGDVYVTDSAQAAVYRIHAGKLEPFVRDEHLTFANGIVLAPDQQRLYVAHVEGVSLVDLPSRKIHRLRVPVNASVNSIDGLAYHEGDLIGVQGSAYLSRVIRISLVNNGTAVKRVTIINAHHPAEYRQTTAAVAGKQLYVVAGSPAADTAGSLLAKEPKPQILRMPLR